MKLTWLGHSGFRLEIGDQVLLIDPWLGGNPSFPDARRAEALAGATHILLTHAHFDHASDVAAISRETGAPVVGIFDLVEWLKANAALDGTGFNKGGTVMLGDVAATMVNAVHSSSLEIDGRPVTAGSEAGYILRGEDRTLYLSGDTDVMADMGVIAKRYAPRIGILCCGGHFTMDLEGAAFAAREYFDFDTIVPCHYATFPILAQSAEPLRDALPGIDVRLPAVMETITL